MDSLLFPNCGLRAPLIKIGHCRAIHRKENADGVVFFATRRGLPQSSISIVRSEANRKGTPRRNARVDRTAKESGQLKDQTNYDSEVSKTSNQDEIISLFRRIQSSISKGGSVPKRISLNSLKEKQEVQSIQQNPKGKQVQAARGKDEVTSLKDATSEDAQPKDHAVPGNAKLSRPVSIFVKKSPIPPPPLTQETSKDVPEEQLHAAVPNEASELQELDNMKLPELKEVARTKGVKGYSRMKKGELLEVLKVLVQSS
ncbi:uncharacterized protein [Typha latifolia]|uniref:uncharacterized protein n=1 Tax=Typha latifolia TaxID=4733 RepID=UPI003C2FA4BD